MATERPPETEHRANVFSLASWRDKKINRPSLKSYQSYLRLLTSGQLLSEVKILIEEFRNRTLGRLEFSKGEMLLQEMGLRFSSESVLLKGQVERMTRELREKMNRSTQ